jgi:hypothetical protein
LTRDHVRKILNPFRLANCKISNAPSLAESSSNILPNTGRTLFFRGNPEGEDQDKESVTLSNQGSIVIDLSGRKLRDRLAVKHLFQASSQSVLA